MSNRKLLVCDVEGTIFKAEYKIPGTDYASTMWQPIAYELGKNAVREERETHKKWDDREKLRKKGKPYYSNYLEWVKDTVLIHQKYNLRKEVFERLISEAKYNDGVVEFFERIKNNSQYIPVLISGGFQELIKRAQRELGIEHGFGACEYIWDENGNIKAWNLQPSDFEDKFAFLNLLFRHYNLKDTNDWIFIGDGKNDADIASRAPISFAINPHVELAAVATYTVDNFMDILKILSSDEALPYISKRRGLSNQQAITVGQRMLNMGEDREGSIRPIRATQKRLKYFFNTQIKDFNNRYSTKEIFEETIFCILNFSKRYAESEEMENEIRNKYNSRDIQSFRLQGISQIETAYFEQEKWAIHISSPDIGTYFRQPIVGCSFDMDISISYKDVVTLCVKIYSKLPEGHFTEKQKIELESYRPRFLDELNEKFSFVEQKTISKESECIRLSAIKECIDYQKRTVPIVVIRDREDSSKYKLDTKSIAKALFTYAHIYTLKCSDFDLLLEEYNIYVKKNGYSDNLYAEVTVFYPHVWGVDNKTWYTNDILDCSDRIGYCVEQQQRKLYSKEKAFEKQLIDAIIDKHKEGILKIKDNPSGFYADLHDKELKKALSDASRMSVENRTDEIKQYVQKKLAEYNLNLTQLSEKVTLTLTALGMNSNILKNKFIGVKEVLIDGELVISLMRTALNESGQVSQVSASILQPFSNAVEVFLKAKILLAIPIEERKSFIDVYNDKTFGELVSYLNNNDFISVKQGVDKQGLIKELREFSKQRGEENAHNCTFIPIEEIKERIDKIYEILEFIDITFYLV